MDHILDWTLPTCSDAFVHHALVVQDLKSTIKHVKFKNHNSLQNAKVDFDVDFQMSAKN